MNVCMIVHKDYHTDVRVRRYAEALADAGVNVDVFCLKASHTVHPDTPARVRTFAIPLASLVSRQMNYLLAYTIALLWFACWLAGRHLTRHYAVVHVHNMPDFFVLAAIIPRLFGAKVILDIHDPMPEFYQSKYGRQSHMLGVRLLRWQERLSAALAHFVITANENFRGNLIARGIAAEKIAVVNNVADPRWFDRSRFPLSRRQPHTRFTLIYPGTIAPRYGLEVVVRALPLLIADIPLRLLLIGPHTPHVDELVALANQLGVAGCVEVKGVIPVHEVPQHIAEADVGIYPALPDPHMSIATPTKVLEYAVMGIPTVASRLKIVEDMFGESAVQFFEPGNVEQFAACVRELYYNPAHREALVRNADHVFVRTHKWENERHVYFSVMNSLLGVHAKIKERIVYPSA